MLVEVSSKDLKQSKHKKQRKFTWVFSTTRAAVSPCAVIEVSAFSYVLEFFTIVSCNIQFCFTEFAHDSLEQNNFKHLSL